MRYIRKKPRREGRGYAQSVGLSRHPTLAQKLRRNNPSDAKVTPQSTGVWNPFLSFHFGCGNGLCRKLEHRCFLTFQ